MAGRESSSERHDLLLVGDAELARGLDRVDGVVTAVRHRDHFRSRRLGLQHEGREVGRAKRMADGAQDLAAVLFDERRGAGLQRAAVNVVGGDEEPGLAELRQDPADGGALFIAVIDPVHRIVGRAGLAGEIRRSRARQQHGLVVGFGDLQHREPDRRIDQIGDDIDLLEIEPAPRNRGTYIRLVLVIGENDLNRHAVDLVAKLLRRHLRRFDRADAGILLVWAGKIGQHSDLDLAAGHLGMRRGGEKQECGQAEGVDAHVFLHLIIVHVGRFTGALSSRRTRQISMRKPTSITPSWGILK